MTQAFGAESTTDEVLEGVDLSDERILVTGTSSGLGVETVRALATHGATVIGTARDMAKAQRALAEVSPQAAKGDAIDLVELDLASLRSVRRAASELLAQARPFDVIIANAGVMACPEGKTEDGFETQFGTNHLGHFVFVNKLVPLLKPGGRVVTLASGGHQFSDVDLDDPNFTRTEYQPFTAYGRSKTANILFAVALDHRLRGRGIRATAVHPGAIQTELGRHLTPEMIEQMLEHYRVNYPGWTPIWKSIPQGAATPVWSGFVATSEAVGGRYCEDCHVADVNDDVTTRGGVRSYAIDPARADALWSKSEEMVGERFSFN